ncbi:CoA-transferase family III domain-containing protein [Podospora australis]|uniref:CoA-transferase family III domain-containing protein n=1 Tax=Podospora australis TaxID=1536484 RepID=A0AAN6WUQ2_9PEZI|nr:CoA-transferase family III domain-containing protein [Podospora australis]
MTRVLAGPYCTQILGDLGAEVIKIEHPVRGDDTRAWGPPYAKYKSDSKHEGPGESAYFLGVNRNKKSLALSFQDPAGIEILHKLAAKCDILVENYIPGSLKKYGLDFDTVHKINPKLIYASITGYGQTGPYSQRAGYDVMVEAEFGLMHITGARDGPPVKVGVAVTDLTTGLYTSNSIMAALLARAKTGKGQHIDAALSDCQTVTLANIASSCLISSEKDTGRWGTAHPSIVPYKSFETKDGDILFGGGNDRLFGILCDGLGRPQWKEDSRYKVNASRVAHRDELEAEIEKITKTRTTQEWLDVFEGKGMPYAAVNDVLTTLTHSHTQARDMVVEVDHGECGPIKLLNTPIKYSESKPRIRSPPPTLGQHTDEILREHVGMDDQEIGELKAKGSPLKEDLPTSTSTLLPAYESRNMASDADAPEPPKGAPEQPPNPTTEVPKDAPKTVPVAATINRASPAPSMSGSSAPYIPQFTAATQLILKRMKGESSSLSAALSQASKSPSVTASIPSATYDDVKRRLVMSMNTSTQMTVKMPVGNPSAGSSTLSMPTTTVPRSAGTAAALSAIRKVTSGLVGPAAAKSTPSKTQASPRVISSESKVKKTKGTNAGRIHANKRRRAKGQSADNSSVSDQSDTEAATPATTTAGTATPPAAPPSTIMTKSGRQVQKPDSYNPVAMDAATRKRVHYGKRTVEQALCKKCTRMHSPHNNQIVFCDGCNEGWHQLCHEPHIHDNLVSDTAKHWYCADCSAKRERQHAPKKPKVEQPRPKESWAGKSVQQKRAYLSTLSTQELVGLLMTSLELHPDLPIFPGTVVDAGVSAQGAPRSIFAGTTTEGLFPRADANPTGQINYIRKVQGGAGAKSSGGSGKGGKGSAGKAATQQKEQSQDRMNEEDEEFDPLMVLWPKPGMGLYSRLRPDTEDDENLADENDFEAFSVIRYDDRGRKLEENGMKV